MNTVTLEKELIEIVSDLPKNSAKEVIDFAKYLRWQSASSKKFPERVDDLWTKMKKQIEFKKFKPSDVARFIEEIKKQSK
ncbi:hypothetical protein A3J90_03565 [candidate division WOR-1 bacterium RIFOXYC2_FULL_37_10]|uniref:DUF2281 domain-containing protein n=1 Tax=candidate division WOR-1 bacterium RIFOXYB2_FULL_37_13 TaxID=1802579 RepID=A0A1F4SLW9_UNCSA|nr:MAG: hypothetical protein A2246_02225 [candidate division WOR-1 bacterium RIFOXYA2_FULL_37_7]OGC21464.1 MAG: hypothetical protein A2310_03190 [candidate division WOR-1 bacterium RIFOXYB2_FULL_37_13]OGC36543.1 MAG: hypothetical protein A3J90_03565 [candidate division WOR-1 bacterium RIFOXYC2_FULL_37_10]